MGSDYVPPRPLPRESAPGNTHGVSSSEWGNGKSGSRTVYTRNRKNSLNMSNENRMGTNRNGNGPSMLHSQNRPKTLCGENVSRHGDPEIRSAFKTGARALEDEDTKKYGAAEAKRRKAQRIKQRLSRTCNF